MPLDQLGCLPTYCTDTNSYCGNQFCAVGGPAIDIGASCDVNALPHVVHATDAGGG